MKVLVRRLLQILTVLLAAVVGTVTLLLTGSPAAAQLPEGPLVDGETVFLCSKAFQALVGSTDGQVATAATDGATAQWLVSRSGDTAQLQNVSTGTWLNNASNPVHGVDVQADPSLATTVWKVTERFADPEVLLENSSVSVVNELLRIGTEPDLNVVTVGGTGLDENGVGGFSQGSLWRVVPTSSGDSCSDATNATISNSTLEAAVGETVDAQLASADEFGVQLELVSGTIPDGLRLSGGFLRGVPTSPGTSSFEYRLVLSGRTETATATVNVADGSATTATVDDAATIPVGIRAEVDLVANDSIVGGIDGNSGVTLASGQIPPGMFLAFNGVVAGRPHEPGTFAFGYQISSSDGSGALGSAVITVSAGTPTEASSDNISLTQGERVFQSVFFTDDTVSAALSRVEFVSGTLPAGVSLNNEGSLTGTPTESGEFEFTYRLLSTSGSSDVGMASVSVAPSEGETVANDDFYEVEVGLGLSIEPLANDTFSADFQSLEILSGEVPGMEESVFARNTLAGQPVEVGEFELTYRITSTSGSTDTGTIRVVVTDGEPVVLEDTLFYDDGTPATGVTVRLVRRTGVFRGQRTFATTTVGADGSFRFDFIRGSYNLYYEPLDDAVYIDANGRFSNPSVNNVGHDRFILAEPGDVIQPINLRLARTTSSIGGGLVDTDGIEVRFASVDFSAPDGDGRIWQRSVPIADDGNFSAALPPGEWIVTAAVFTSDGPRYIERRITLADGDVLAGVEVSLRDGVIRLPSDGDTSPDKTGVVSGSVTDDMGAAVTGVFVDRFSVADDGSRAQWLGDEVTDASGEFSFTVDPACYIFVFIAPDGAVFPDGSRYEKRHQCVEAGQNVSIDVVLEAAATGKTSIVGSVSYRSGKPAEGVTIDWFRAGADGSRTAWLGDTITADDGAYRFDIEPGCGVLVFIAPYGQVFTNNSGYFEQPVCVAAGETTSSVDAVLLG